MWEHRCSLDWLKKRQGYLTASEAARLLPYTKTGRPRKITTNDYFKLWLEKKVDLTEEDTLSTGAAARGHLLEPYAVEEFNRITKKNFYHWDDVLSTDESVLCGASFDAANVPCGEKGATEILEIKSYGVKKHIDSITMKMLDHEERWQLAFAMALFDDIELGHLLFYNPSLRSTASYHLETYARNVLKFEIDEMKEIIAKWDMFVEDMFPFAEFAEPSMLSKDEKAIVNEISKRSEFDPGRNA